MSVFLMGSYDPSSKQFCTVTKCGNGHDDKKLEQLQKELKMTKISKVIFQLSVDCFETDL